MLDRINLSRLLFYILIAFLPTQLGSFFFFNFSYVSGVRIDYLAPAFYLTDIVVLLLILLNLPAIRILLRPSILWFLAFLLVGIIFSTSPYVGLFKFVKLLEVILLYSIARRISLHYKMLLFILLGSSILQLILAVYQMSYGSALQGVWYFLGERNFTLGTTGIAKVTINGHEFLRAYGSFSHPNSLAGFYLAIYTYLIFSNRASTYFYLKYMIIGIMSLLIFLSFSKVAIITYLIITLYHTVHRMKNICLFCVFSKMFVLLMVAGMFLQAHGDNQTVNKRLYLAGSSLDIIESSPLLGTGLGNYLYAQSTIANPYPYHFLEPVHNIFLLAVAELGIPLFVFGIYTLFPHLRMLWRIRSTRALLICIIITGMLDHYWITLQQNILLLPVLFALLKHEDKYDKIDGTKAI